MRPTVSWAQRRRRCPGACRRGAARSSRRSAGASLLDAVRGLAGEALREDDLGSRKELRSSPRHRR
eukprot:3924760-Alexandrium_andersonii.AAC.1